MRKPIYKYPDFVQEVTLKRTDGKRYWLTLKIDDTKTDGIAVILKNPSRADKTISDKTVYNVSNYIYRNRENYTELQNIGTVTIVNLIPKYLTDSSKLQDVKEGIIDDENIRVIDEVCSRNKNVIIAWGNPPMGLDEGYEVLKKMVMAILSKHKNSVFYVDRMTYNGNPKHGQVWGYNDMLIKAK
ncbi:DUF1643 domain-containing protein [Maribacter sp. CXY002]|uniref:DUF1643 domain-containing protein n=1 Tax=Maribacter luteocoastalis TaxID=3407671 RepID=UPI003B6809B5